MDAFQEYLQENQDKHFTTITPGGNHGDTLIHMGMTKKLGEYGIEYNSINLEKEYNKDPVLLAKYLSNIALWKLGSDIGFKLIDIPNETDIILFEGGGYMSDVWYGPTLLNQITKHNPHPITIAPQSYIFRHTKFADYFQDKRETTLFCREKYSYDHLAELDIPLSVQVKVSPELSLYLKKEDLTEYNKPKDIQYELICFRDDKESMISSTLRKEVQELCENPVISDISMKDTLTMFVSWVENASEIYTDRLHVAILSMILGKKVSLFGNSYHKNKGVWEYSLKDKVTFIET